jgi:hypothetical protein
MTLHVICYGLPDNSFAFLEMQPGHKIGTGQPHTETFTSRQAATDRLIELGYTPDSPTLSTEQQMPLAIDLSDFKEAISDSATIQAAIATSMNTYPLTAINLVAAIARAEESGDFTEFIRTFRIWIVQNQISLVLLGEILGLATIHGFPETVLTELQEPVSP